jgi:hypothetical protein
MTIHPPPSALERLRTTSAITPLPIKTRTMVPMNSPTTGDCIRVPLDAPFAKRRISPNGTVLVCSYRCRP